MLAAFVVAALVGSAREAEPSVISLPPSKRKVTHLSSNVDTASISNETV
jgi:hypothetical protein